MPKVINNIKETILKESKSLLIEKSYNQFTIRQLAINCDLSVGTIYNYFSTKEDVINSVFYEDWNTSLNRMKNINNNFPTLEEKLKEVYKEMETFLSTYISIFHDIFLSSKSYSYTQHLDTLYALINNILLYEKENNMLNSNLAVETISIFIVNNLMILCKNPNISFKDFFSLLNL